MPHKLAPIVVSVYTRFSHFRRCIESLQRNNLATDSEVFIYSDASSRPEDESLVNQVRYFSNNISGFKKVHVIEREKNYGGVNNALSGQREITAKYGNSIFLEDDIVVAPGFLAFMNEALRYYKDEKRVVSLTGYCPPINTEAVQMQGDVYALPRYCGWGSGVWKDRLEDFPDKIDKNKFIKVPRKHQVFSACGEDVLGKIHAEASGEIDAQDVRNMYYQALNNKYTIYPVKSLIQNIGHDGSGVHSDTNNKFLHNELWDKVDGFSFVENIQLNEEIVSENYKFRSHGVKARILKYLWLTGLYPLLKQLKDKLHK